MLLSLTKYKPALKDSYSRNGILFICEGSVGAIAINLVNPFISMFAKHIGAGDYEIGLINALPALIGILALIPGSLLVDNQRDKKKIVGLLLLLTGVMYPLQALSPFLGNIRVYSFIILFALMNWPFSVFNISWQSFFSDVFPLGKRNEVFAKRSSASTFLGIVTMLFAGLVLAYLPATDKERIIIYQVFFVAAFILYIVQAWFLSRISGYELQTPALSAHPFSILKDCLKQIPGNKQFLTFSIIAFIFYITWQMAWPLFFIYQVDYLHANEAWLSYIALASGLTNTITFPFWSKMIQKKGAKLVIIPGGIGLAINSAALVMTNSLIVVVAINIFTGLFFSAFLLAIFENMLDAVPQENKTLFIAFYTTLLNVSGFLAPMLGVFVYKMTSIYFTMILNGFLRLSATGLFYIYYRLSLKKGWK